MYTEESVNNLFGVLADPTRRRIVEMLSNGRALTVSGITGEFGMSRQAVTKHLGLLCEAGLIDFERQGRDRLNRLRPGALDPLLAWTRYYSVFWEGRLEALKQQVEGGNAT